MRAACPRRRPHRFQLVLGPRCVGKTTALTQRRLIDDGIDPGRIRWMRLDHPLLLQESPEDLVRAAIEACGASAERPAFLMLDELATPTGETSG